MTPEWIKPLALQRIGYAIGTLVQALESLHDPDPRADYWLRGLAHDETDPSVVSLEWAIAQQLPPHLWLGPEHAACAGGINFGGQRP